LCSGAPALAQQNSQLSGAPAQQMDLRQSSSPDATESLTLTVNKSYMIEFNTDIDDIIIANHKIATITSPDRRPGPAMGLAPAESNIVFLDRSGRQIKVVEISVTDGVAGMDQLRGLIKKHVPGSKVEVESINGKIILSGQVPNLSGADRVMQLAS